MSALVADRHVILTGSTFGSEKRGWMRSSLPHLKVLDGLLLVAEDCRDRHAHHERLDPPYGPHMQPDALSPDPYVRSFDETARNSADPPWRLGQRLVRISILY